MFKQHRTERQPCHNSRNPCPTNHGRIWKLDSIFPSETIEEAYHTYSKFINFSRQESSDMNDYIIEFEYLYKKMRDIEMKLPDPVLAFKLHDVLVLVMMNVN